MPRNPQMHPHETKPPYKPSPSSFPAARAVPWAAFLFALGGCGEVTCPESFVDLDATCVKLDPVTAGEHGTEPCDGIDNDGDTLTDEDWPEIGEPCGESAGEGECVAGVFVCAADGMGVVCEGAVGPTAEVCDGKDNDCDGIPDNGPEETCDGKDNDCDGLIDEGVLTVKKEAPFDDFATVAAVTGGFAVTRLVDTKWRVETYDEAGSKTGHHDDISLSGPTAFAQSDGSGNKAYVALGKYRFYVLEIHVDSDLIPIIMDSQELHESWEQGIDFGVYDPPAHPRVVASSRRFLGYRNLLEFAVVPFDEGSLAALAREPALADKLSVLKPFAVSGPFVAWQQSDKVRAGWLLDDGSLTLDMDVGRGSSPSTANGSGGPAVLSLKDGNLALSELVGGTIQCKTGGFCNESIDAGELLAEAVGPTGLAFHEPTDTWFIAAGSQIIIVGRTGLSAVVKQVDVRDDLDEAPNRLDVAVSGDTLAVMQSTKYGESALTFLECF